MFFPEAVAYWNKIPAPLVTLLFVFFVFQSYDRDHLMNVTGLHSEVQSDRERFVLYIVEHRQE